jgi:hypothetical protein
MRKIFTLFKLIITLRIFKFLKFKMNEFKNEKLKEKKIPSIIKFINEHKFKEKKIKFTNNKKSQILIECMWDNPVHWIRMAIIKPAIEKKYGSRTCLLRLDKINKSTKKIIKNLGYNNEEILPDKIPSKYKLKANKILNRKNITDNFLYNLKLPGGFPAFYFYDEILKKNAIGKIEGSKVNYKFFLAKTLFYLDFYKSFLDRNSINTAILSHQITIRYSTLIWMMLKKNIPVYFTNYYNGHIIIKKIDQFKKMLEPFDDALYLSDIKKLNFKKKRLLSIQSKKYMKKLKSGKDGELTVFGIHQNKKNKIKRKKLFLSQLGIENKNPIAIIFANCWTDYPSGYGKNPFSNYVDWIEFTLKRVDKIKNINWILKPHPGEKLYGEKITCEEIFYRLNLKNIKLWPKQMTNIEVERYSDFIISARSSSTLEYGINGKKVICCFPSPFSNFPFVKFAKDKKQLLKVLNNLNTIKQPKKEDILEAQIFSMSLLGDYKLNKFPKFPYGADNKNIYSYINKFLTQNKKKLIYEANLINKWVLSNHDRYNVFKIINE